MTRPVSVNLRTAAKPVLKNPLRASTMSLLGPAAAVSEEPEGPGHCGAEQAAPEVTAQQLRQMQISEFSAWLRTQINKHQRPFQEEMIRGCAETARALDLWMAETEVDGDFTACDVRVLNAFFAAYRNSHSQGGINTRQRNLHHLFKWLAHPDPWSEDMVRYGWDERTPVPLPRWMTDQLQDKPPPATATPSVAVPHGVRGTAYAMAALREETRLAATARPGTHNDTLNRAAFSLGQLTAARLLPSLAVVSALASAAERAGLPKDETHRTIRSGMTAGARKPRDS